MGKRPPAKKQDGSDRNQDVVLLHSKTDDGEGLRAIRSRQGKVELTEIRPLKEGKPLQGELIRLSPRDESPLLYDVEVEYAPQEESPSPSRSGPPRIATERYRRNWKDIFDDKASSTNKKALN